MVLIGSQNQAYPATIGAGYAPPAYAYGNPQYPPQQAQSYGYSRPEAQQYPPEQPPPAYGTVAEKH